MTSGTCERPFTCSCSNQKSKILGNTIVPTKLFGGSRHIKLEIALASGKKKYDKRISIKHRDLDRERQKY